MSSTISWLETDDPNADGGLDFRIEREGKRDITGALWLPADGEQRDALICCGHGGSGYRYQAPLPSMARKFNKEGYPVLAIDGPDHGLRQSGPGGRMGLAMDLQRGPVALDEMTEDWADAIDAVRARDDVNAPRLAYYGASMGSMYGIPFLATRSDVVVAALGLLGETEALPITTHIKGLAEKVTCPLYYMVQLDDESFSSEGSVAMFQALGSANKRMHANPGLHAAIPIDEVGYLIQFMLDHLDGTLQPERKVAMIA